MDISKLQGNSNASKKSTKKERKMPDPMTMRGEVKTKTRSTGRKVIDNLFKEDLDTIKTEVYTTVIDPSIRDIIFNALQAGLELALFGQMGKRRKSGNGGRTAYGGFYNNPSRSAGSDHERDRERPKRRTGYDLTELEFESKDDATDILDYLCDEVEQYGDVPASVLLKLLDQHPTHADTRYGWSDLSKASIDPARGGIWILRLPRPEALE